MTENDISNRFIPCVFSNIETSSTATTKAVHRLVGGHLHHSVYRKEENNFSPQSPSRLSKLYFRRKPVLTGSEPSLYTSTQPTTPYPSLRSATDASDALAHIFTTTQPPKTTSSTESNTNKQPVFIVEAQKYNDPEYDTNQIINYDKKRDNFVVSSAGDGKEERKKDETKKTLSDQVAEGKYGLIQNEIFKIPPKRPGVLSYATNPETPNDTVENLGGLSSDEIWLAEDHLLVLKGGGLNSDSNDEPWKPIDDYQAPPRQVKIPANPKVPPPFLVQLDENGPIEFIGNNQLPLINPFTNESILLFPDGGFPKTQTYSQDQTHLFARPGTAAPFANGNQPPLSYYPSAVNGTQFNGPHGQLPFPPPPNHPFVMHIPLFNGSLDDANVTDAFDEDDPSFYYPPPYSFVYKSNYTNLVEPGPLVPGIILPPPPNFFGRLENDDKRSSTTTTSRPLTTVTTHKYKQLRPVYRPSTTISPSQLPTVKALKPVKTQTEAFRNHVLNPTRLPDPVTTQKTHAVTQLHQLGAPEIVAFIPKDAMLNGPNTKSNPIYYEYFDARVKTSTHNTPSYVTTVLPTTTSPSARPMTKHKQQALKSTKQTPRRPSNTYLPTPEYQNYVIITPKPESKPNAIIANTVTVNDIQSFKSKLIPPAKQYNSEIDNIRHTIEFFKNQQDHSIPTPNTKTKAVFEYSFDASPAKNTKAFRPPSEYDTSPFRPMFKFSEPMNGHDGFKAIAYTTVPTASTNSDEISTTTTTTTPKPPNHTQKSIKSNLQYIPTLDHAKKPAVKFIPIDVSLKHSEYSTVTPIPAVSTSLPLSHSTIHPWISVEKQIIREIRPKEINVQIQSHTPTARPLSLLRGIAPHESSYIDANANSGQFNGYFYPPQTNYAYQQPRPVMTAQQNAYLRQIEVIRHELQQYPNPIRYHTVNHSKQVNYRVPRPLNHQQNNGFVSSYHIDSHRFPHLSQILSPDYNLQAQQQRLPQTYQPLHRDGKSQHFQAFFTSFPPHFYCKYFKSTHQITQKNITVLVNYKYPLPSIEPESEYLPPPHLLHPLPPAPPHSTPSSPVFNRFSRLIRKPATVVQYKLPGDHRAGVYFYSQNDDDDSDRK